MCKTAKLREGFLDLDSKVGCRSEELAWRDRTSDAPPVAPTSTDYKLHGKNRSELIDYSTQSSWRNPTINKAEEEDDEKILENRIIRRSTYRHQEYFWCEERQLLQGRSWYCTDQTWPVKLNRERNEYSENSRDLEVEKGCGGRWAAAMSPEKTEPPSTVGSRRRRSLEWKGWTPVNMEPEIRKIYDS